MASRSFDFVRSIALAASLGLFLFVGSGCGISLKDAYPPQTTGFYISDAYSLPMDLWNKGVTYDDQLKMSAAADWQPISNELLQLVVPFSKDWSVAGQAILPVNFYADHGSTDGALSFGRFVSNGTYFSREYTLTMSVVPFVDVAPPVEVPLQNECLEVRDASGTLLTLPPQEVTVGTTKGVSLLVGGTKGCSTVFRFARWRMQFELSKHYPMGQDDFSHQVTPDMERIIESLQIQSE